MSRAKAVQVFAQYGVPDPVKMDQAQLRAAWMWLMKKHHTDVGGNGDASAFINSAYDTLKRTIGQRFQPEPEQRKPDPPKSVPRFRLGQYVVHTGDDNRVGKIYGIRSGKTIYYDIRMLDSINATETVEEASLRRATQEDLDMAQATQTPSRPLFTDGQYIVSLDDGKIGTIDAPKGSDYDRSTRTRYYNVVFLDGEKDLLSEKNMRAATENEVKNAKAKLSREKQTTSKSGASNSTINEIVHLAHYRNDAERSDKIYGVVRRKGKVYTFWGGTRKALATKQFDSSHEAFDQFSLKLRKGYREIPITGTPLDQWLQDALNARFQKIGESRRYI